MSNIDIGSVVLPKGTLNVISVGKSLDKNDPLAKLYAKNSEGWWQYSSFTEEWNLLSDTVSFVLDTLTTTV